MDANQSKSQHEAYIKNKGKSFVSPQTVNKKETQNKDKSFELHIDTSVFEKNKNESWTELKIKEKNIMKRCYHSSVFHNNKLYVYGGYEINHGILSDFYYLEFLDGFNISNWTKITPKTKEAPGPLCRHTISLYKDTIILFGGQKSATENTNALWHYDIIKNQWFLIPPNDKFDVPCLDSHAANIYFDQQTQNSHLIISSGFVGGKKGEYTNAVLSFCIETKKWSWLFKNSDLSNTIPVPRAGAGTAIVNQALYLFGGTNGHEKFQDLWKFNLVDLKWQEIKSENPPDPRNGHSMLSYKDNYLIIFGGIEDITHEKDDVVCYDIKNNKWIIVENDTIFTLMSPGRTDRRNLSKMDQSQISSSPYPRSKSPKKNKGGSETQTTYLVPQRDNSFKDKSPGSAKKEMELKAIEMKKNMLLAQFEVNDPNERKLLKTKSPTTQQMMSSILAINDKLSINDEKLNKKRSSIEDLSSLNFSQLNIEQGNKVVGHKPCARDGHSAVIHKGHMIVFGGDRHRMSFNDLHIFNLEYASQQNNKEKAM